MYFLALQRTGKPLNMSNRCLNLSLSVTRTSNSILSLSPSTTNIQAIKEQLWIVWPIFALLETHYNFITQVLIQILGRKYKQMFVK